MHHIVQFIRIAHVRPCLFPHLRDCRLVESAHFFQHRFRQHAAHLDGARPALFERCVIKIGVRIRVENLVRKLRWNRRVDCDAADSSVRQPR